MQPGALPFPRKELSPREALAVEIIQVAGWGAGTIASKGIVVTIKEGGREKQNGPDLRDA